MSEEDPKIVFPAGTPLDDVFSVIETLAKGTVHTQKDLVELIKIVSDGADRSDKILLNGIDKLGKALASALELVNQLEQRVSMLEGKETKH